MPSSDSNRFPYHEGGKKAEAFVVGYFSKLAEHPEISRVWKDLKTLVQVHLTNPDFWAVIDTRKGEMDVSAGKTNEAPELTLTLEADDFHGIYSGQLNVLSAFASQKVLAEGKIAIIMETTWTLPQAIEIYRNHCQELGITFPELEQKKILKEEKEEISGTRSERLRKRFASAQREICIDRARYLTQSLQETEGEPQILRQAKAFANVLENLSVNIFPDEILVGNITGKFLGAGVYPEGIAGRVLGELDNITTRPTNPFAITEEDKQELREIILPYWKGKTLESRAREIWSPEVARAFDKIGIFILTEVGGIGHILLNHPLVIDQGLDSVIKQARTQEKVFMKEGNQDAVNFCQAVQISTTAVIKFAKRHATLAKKLAKTEADPTRKQELLDIAERCKQVPANPATTFADALQATLFTHICAQIESSIESGISLGRIDQFLWPYYKQDFDAALITRDEAQELLECFYIKLSHNLPLFDSDVSLAFSGLTTFANAVVGGLDSEGNDVTNDLSPLVLEAMHHIQTPNPTLGVRLHSNSPPEFLEMIAKLLLDGMSNIQFLNDDVIVTAMLNIGVPIEEARNYAIIGCVEPAVPGRSFTSSDAALFNLALPVELAMHNGDGLVFQEQIGPRTGDATQFASMNLVLTAYKKQVKHLIKLMAEGLEGLAQAHAELKPTPFMSGITDDCLQVGKDLTAGGAHYNFTGVQGVGLATAADSLTAIDTLLFQNPQLAWNELLPALTNDFERSENLRQQLITKAPKFGNDDDTADKYARFVAELYCNEVSQYETLRGGTLIPGLYSVTTHIPFGLTVGALPNGRKVRTTLSYGITPSPGAAQKGPTAAIRSVAKLNHELVANGSAFNLLLSPDHFTGEEGAKLLQSLVTTYFKLGGMQIQFNLVDTNTLREAQQHPEEYSDLIVRVAGYSALFVDLDQLVQEEIINRTQFTKPG